MQSVIPERVVKYDKDVRGARKERFILVVDDEESVGIGMTGILKAAGYNAAYVMSGKDAVEEVKKVPYSLVFMDMVMPGMNGLDTFRAIKRERRAVKVVLFTGFFKDADRMILEGIKEGMIEEFIRKPFFAQEIIGTVKKYT